MPYFDDDGRELNPDLIPKPDLCVACANDDAEDEMEHILCTLTRLDQQDEETFVCFAYLPKSAGDSTDNLEEK